MASPTPEARFFKTILGKDLGRTRWCIRMATGHEYRSQVTELPDGAGVAGLAQGFSHNIEYIRLDQIEAVREI